MKKNLFSAMAVIIIASTLIITGVYAYRNINSPKLSPDKITLNFYEEWLSYENNPLVDKIYQNSEYLTDSFKERIEEIISTFDKSAYDPILCAQDKPEKIEILDTIIEKDTAIVLTKHIYSGGNKTIEIKLINNSSSWKINHISCSENQTSFNDSNSGVSPTIQQRVSEYIQNNISNLSPEKEVLGAKFIVDSIEFIDARSCLVNYEDGHIAFKAKIEFEIPNADEIKIINFNILPDENINFSQTGNVVQQENDWYLIYEKPGQPALKNILLFDDNSECLDERIDNSCLPIYWKNGDRVEIKGWQKNQSIQVNYLRVVGETSKNISDDNKDFCEDKCGNGTCEEMVCLGQGCPCAETPDNCPQDCK